MQSSPLRTKSSKPGCARVESDGAAVSHRTLPLSAHLQYRHAHLGLLQNRYHLLDGKTLSPHGKISLPCGQILPETNSQSLLRMGGPVTIMTAPVSQLILAVAVRREPPGAPHCLQKPCCGAGLDFDPPRIPRKSIPLRILVACPLPCKSPSRE